LIDVTATVDIDPRPPERNVWPMVADRKERMAKPIKVSGARDGSEVELPQDLDAIVIQLEHGSLYIDLAGQVPGTVLMRASVGDYERIGPTRLILSPMDSGRMAVGVIKST
jgi:hypothetical protein